jgi:aryl-alcohol dehydrogenase-like predicted oxidoreductase
MQNEMERTRLGSTDLMVSRIGLGTVKFGRTQCLKYPRAFSLPTDEDVQSILRIAHSNGINLLDTAPAYGCSEERVGALRPGRRDDWVIVTKCGEDFANGESSFDFRPQYLRSSLQRSLKRLQTDYIDLLLLHSNGYDEQIIRDFGVFDTLQALKKEGLARAIGFSGKTPEGMRAAMIRSDVLMVSLNPKWPQLMPIIEEAKHMGKGILTKHTLNSGRFEEIVSDDPIASCLDLALNKCSVDCALVGTSDPVHFAEIIDKATEVMDTVLGVKAAAPRRAGNAAKA